MKHFLLRSITILFLVAGVAFATAPTVSSTSPWKNNLHVSASANITITFNQSMDNSSITTSTFKVYGLFTGFHAGSLSYGAQSATFNPTNDFKAGEQVFVTVTTGVENASDEAMATPYVYTFTVDATSGYAKFKAPANYTAQSGGSGNYYSVIADLDGDGDLDVATDVTLFNKLAVFMNNGDGTFASAVNYTTLTGREVKAADVDGDGDLDLVTANNNAHGVSVFVNSSGTFSTRNDFDFSPTQSTSGSVVVVDIDGDGDIDIVASDTYYNNIHVLKNNGSGTFTSTARSTTLILNPLSFGDIDNDGDMDIVGSNGSSDSVETFLNDGTGALSFSTRYYWTGSGYGAVLLADINSTSGDKIDLLWANTGSSSLTYFADQSGVPFYTAGNINVGDYPSGIAAVDVDTDNDLDLVVANQNDATFSLLSNNGSGSFTSTHTYSVSDNPEDINSADLDGDGDMDVVTTNDDGKISVLLNYNGGHVSSVTPDNASLDIVDSTDITIVFDENIDSTTLTSSTIKITGSISGVHSWTRSSYNTGTYTAILNPSSNFVPGEVVSVAVTTGIENGDDIALERSYTSSFTVEAGNTGGYFAPKTDYASGDQTQAVVSADLNADGYADIAAVNTLADNIAVFINNGDGTYATAVTYAAGDGPSSIAAGDVNGDGKVDLVVTTTTDNVLSVFINNNNTSFNARTTVSTSSSPNYIALADIDADGDLDVVYTAGSYVFQQKNNGAGSFSSEENGNPTSTPVGLAVADIDNDGDVDFLTANAGSSYIRVSYNNGSNWYASGNSYTVGTSPTSIVTGDFNNDGYIDAVTTNLAGGTGTISYMQNNQSGGFNSKVDYTVATSAQPRGVTAMDIDGDGDLDLAVTNSSADSVVVFTNNGSGTFSNGGQFSTGDNPYGIAAADFDGDDDLDVVTANYTGDNISVLKNSKSVQFSSLSPSTNAVNVTTSSDVVITFNQAMNSGTLTTSTIKVTGSLSGPYSGAVSYDNGTHAATFNPNNNFKAGEVITVRLTTGIQNPDGVSLSNIYQWNFVAAATAEGTFGNRQADSTFRTPSKVEVADMDGDGDVDVVSFGTNYSPDRNIVTVSLNNGTGTLGVPDSFSVGNYYFSNGVVADFTGDGRPDVAVLGGYQGDSTLAILTNDGAGNLSAPVNYAVVYNRNENGITAGDVNGDGYNDIIFTQYDNNRVKIMMNDGDGTFTAADSMTTGTTPTGVTVCDIDNDGDMDIVTTDEDAYTFSVFKNNGNGTFAAKTSYSTGSNSMSFVTTGDFNGDGKTDIVVNGYDATEVFLQSGGTFSSYQTLAGNDYAARLGDLDGDGDLDILEPNSSNYTVDISYNNGSGSFASATSYYANNYPQSAGLADMDGDGDLDVVVGKGGGDHLTILKNVETVSVSSTSPGKNAINIDTTASITATFNRDLNTATLVDSTVVVRGSKTGKIAGAISYDGGSKTVTFNPTNNFFAGEEISVTLTTSIQSSNNVNLQTPLTFTFTTQATGTGNFVFQDTIPDYGNSYNYMNSFSSGDVNGDRRIDLLGAYYNNLIKVLKNNTTTFDSISTVAPVNPNIIPMADLDNDGDLDIIAGKSGTNNVTPITNDGAGSFTTHTDRNVSANNPPEIILKDMDNDGRIDIITNSSGSQQVYAYHDDARNFSYSAYSYQTIHYDIKDFACADVNNDGKNDLITVHSGSNNNFVTVTLNNGNRVFASPVDYSITNGARYITVADLNADGYLDVILGYDDTDGYFSILLNDGDGTFASQVDYSLTLQVNQIVPGDVDGDGDIDLVIRAYDDNASLDKMVIAFNNGSGSFANQMSFDIKADTPESYYSYSNLELFDYDNDGDLDIAVHANHYINSQQYENILLFKNSSGTFTAPSTQASSITTSNNYGSTINLSWTNGNGSRRLVVVKQGSAVNATPADNSNFAPSTQFGSGTQLGTGNYVVYGGAGSSLHLTGLTVNTTYHVSVFEMNGTPGNEKVLTTSAPTASFTTGAHEGYPFDTTAGKAIAFNGSSTTGSLPISTLPDNFTAEMWVKVTDSSSTAAFFVRGDGGGGGGGGGEDDFSIPKAPVQQKNLHTKKLLTGKQHAMGTFSKNIAPNSPVGIMSGGVADYSNPIHIGINNTHFYASVWDDDAEDAVTITGSTTLNSNQWYHVALTVTEDDGGKIFHLYVNGNEDCDSGSVGYYSDNGSGFTLGYDGSAYFNGQLDEIQIRNTVYSASQIRASMHKTVSGFPTDIAGYWQFNEGSGTTSANLLNSSYDADLTDVTWQNSTIPLGGGTATSGSVAANTTGSQTVGNVNLNLTDGFDDATDVVVSEVTGSPSSFPTNYNSTIGGKYFIIDAFPYPDSGSFSATLKLTYGAGVLTDNVAANYILYKRGSTSDGSWTSYGSASSVNISTGEVTWTGIASFSQAAVVNTEDELPIELSSFDAKVTNGNVMLNWKTITEVNNAGFDIQRSVVNSKSPKLNTWQKIGSVNGNGTSNTPHEYSFVDSRVQNAVRYRLKQMDRDGKYSYSRILEVKVTAPLVFELKQNYPNPFNPTTTIEFTIPNDGLTTLKIYNSIGQEVATLVNEELKSGEFHKVTFNAQKFASGVYFARLQSSNQIQLKKMLLLK